MQRAGYAWVRPMPYSHVCLVFLVFQSLICTLNLWLYSKNFCLVFINTYSVDVAICGGQDASGRMTASVFERRPGAEWQQVTKLESSRYTAVVLLIIHNFFSHFHAGPSLPPLPPLLIKLTLLLHHNRKLLALLTSSSPPLMPMLTVCLSFNTLLPMVRRFTIRTYTAPLSMALIWRSLLRRLLILHKSCIHSSRSLALQVRSLNFLVLNKADHFFTETLNPYIFLGGPPQQQPGAYRSQPGFH